MRRVILGALLALVATAAQAQGSFCAGFEAGWASAFENRNKIVAITPICPIPPMGRDTFEGGYEIGLLRALSYLAEHGR